MDLCGLILSRFNIASCWVSRNWTHDDLGFRFNRDSFWKDYLSKGTPFLEFDFGKQNLLVSSASLSVEVEWPGVPGDEKPYGNVRTEFDLFSARRYFDVVNKNQRPAAELELWELEDLGALDAETDDV